MLRAVTEGGRVDRRDVVRWVRDNGLPRERARAYLERAGPVTVDDVAQRLRIPKPAALSALRELAAAGAVERCPFPAGGTGLWRLGQLDTAEASGPAVNWPGDRAWLALDARLGRVEARGADTLEPPWWDARSAGEAAIYARSSADLDRACDELRRLLAQHVPS